MNKTVLIVTGLLVIGGGFVLGRSLLNEYDANENNSEVAGDSQGRADVAGAHDESTDEVTGEESASSLDRYVEYSSESLEAATTDGGRAVLFFAALDWCPPCQAADKDFKFNFDQLPDDVTVLKVDYDNDTAMRQKYGIVMQDTFVQVDARGEEVTRWSAGGKGVDALLANLE